MLEIITAASDRNLVTREQVKLVLGISGTADDAFLDLLIGGVSAGVESYLNRKLRKETVKEYFYPQWMGRTFPLRLQRWPVASLVAVVEGTVTLTPLAEKTQLEKDAGLLWRFDGESRYRWAEGQVTVEYVGGFDGPAVESPTNPIPKDIQLGVIEWIKMVYNDRDRASNLKSEKILDVYSVSYFDTPDGLPPTACAFLDPYRDVGQ